MVQAGESWSTGWKTCHIVTSSTINPSWTSMRCFLRSTLSIIIQSRWCMYYIIATEGTVCVGVGLARLFPLVSSIVLWKYCLPCLGNIASFWYADYEIFCLEKYLPELTTFGAVTWVNPSYSTVEESHCGQTPWSS
jgi:hypothetical protein